MSFVQRTATLAEIAKLTQSKIDFGLRLRDFLDGFYAAPGADALVAEPLSMTADLHDEGYADAYLAALAEHLATAHGFPVPAWSFNPYRVLKQPVFALNTYEGRMFLILESPSAFRSRHIFISADGLTRV